MFHVNPPKIQYRRCFQWGMKDRPLRTRAAACEDTARAAVLRAVDIRVLQDVILLVNDWFLASNQNDCVFIIQAPYLVRGHKFTPGLLEVLRERTVPAFALA